MRSLPRSGQRYDCALPALARLTSCLPLSLLSHAPPHRLPHIQDNDEKTVRALLDFSFYMAVGNMDEAFRAVKAIRNNAVWENMAHLCIKNKRLDVAGGWVGGP